MSQSLILLRRGVEPAAFLAAAEAEDVAVDPVPGMPRYYTVAGVAPEELPESVRDHPDVQLVAAGDDEAEADTAQQLTIDPFMTDASWALPRIIRRRAPWNVDGIKYPIETSFRSRRTGSGVDIYVLDTGIRVDHQEFGGRATNIWEGYDSGGLGDDQNHGTQVASAAAGATVGIAREALIWSLKIFNDQNAGTNAVLIAGLGQALLHYQSRAGTNRPAVMNISGGGFGAIVSDAIVDCIDAGMVVCISAGNDRTNLDVAPRFPGQSDPDVILVAGSAMSDTPYHLGFRNRTNYGAAISVVAPAQHIRVASRTSSSSYSRSSGTSYAAPLTAGVLACMLQGTGRLIGRAQVQAVKARLLTVATAGRFRPQPQFGIGALPDRVLYLDPNRSPPEPFGFTA